jgi:hypothetical protein
LGVTGGQGSIDEGENKVPMGESGERGGAGVRGGR